MRTKKKSFLGILLSLALMIGMMPALGLSQTAYADGTTYNPASTYTDYDTLKTNNTVVTINEVANVEWYVIGYNSDAKTVTLLSKTSFGNKAFNSNYSSGNNYASSEIKTFVEGLTGDGQSLAGIKGALANISVTGDPSISGAVPYLLSTTEADALDSTKKGTDTWWLRSPGGGNLSAACVSNGSVYGYGYDVGGEYAVRPALQLNLESVIFKSESGSYSFALKPAGYSVTLSGGANATTSGGATSQTGLTGAMTTVTYTANTGYYFAEFADISSNGITATRTSSTVVTVSGTPTSDATITVPDAVAIPTYEVTYKVVNGTWSDGSSTDKKETVQSGAKPVSVPTGMKASEDYTGGAWDTDPASAAITGAKTFTYSFTAKQAATVTKAPEAKTLTYNGSAQALVTAGTAAGGEMQYALGTATEATQPYTTSIPTATNAGTYYVWYKAIGDDTHSDSKAACVKVTIKEEPKPAKVSGTLMAKMTAKGKTKLAISWNKIKGAAGYDIFFAKCGKKVKKVKSIKGNKTFKWTKSGLKKGKTYLAAVKAYVMKDGKKKYVSNSPYAHTYAGNGNKKFTNAKSVKVKKAKVTLKKGKTFKIKAKVTKVKKSKKLMPKKHVATVRYLSTDKKIATVSSKGKIKAVAKGKCTIYAYAHNGISRSIKVTVK